MADNASMADVFRVTPEGKYVYNNQEISKQEFDRLKAESTGQIQSMRPKMDKRIPLKNRASSAFSELDADAAASEYKKGGKISLNACSVSTHQKSKKSPNW